MIAVSEAIFVAAYSIIDYDNSEINLRSLLSAYFFLQRIQYIELNTAIKDQIDFITKR